MLNKKMKPITAAVGTAFVASLATASIANADSPFAAEELERGYDLLADAHGGEGKCGEGKCGEGAGDGADGEGKCGEGKCGEGDDAEGKCGEGKCGEGDDAEGKCGEGKCGS